MEHTRVATLPRRPADLPEWEDLLVRFEIMPRALRVTLEEADAVAGATAGMLRTMVGEEAELGAWLHEACAGELVEAGGQRPVAREGGEDPRRLADRFASLRARNFAMLQRRGIDVWGWSAPLGEAGVVTAYQMVTGRVAADAEVLRALRALSAARGGIRPGAAAC